MTQYQVYDVFTQQRFGGNQLAVIPDATQLAEGDLQAIAAEFNFSETTFVYPPENPAHKARVRIFTPTNEIPFAGHPTIGTAIAIAQSSGQTSGQIDMVLELGVGPIACEVSLGQPCSATFTTKVPMAVHQDVPVETVARCLGIKPDQVVTKTHIPQIVSVGLPFAMVELSDDAVLSTASPVTDHFRKAEAKYANDIDMFAIFLYVRVGNQINARMFAPLNNIPEDPATGSAAAVLGAYLSHLESRAQTLAVDQGVDMGRSSQIKVSTGFQDGTCTSVTIGGSAVQTMRGVFTF